MPESLTVTAELVFTETQIRSVLHNHRIGHGSGWCYCSWINGTFTPTTAYLYTAEHFIEMLKAC